MELGFKMHLGFSFPLSSVILTSRSTPIQIHPNSTPAYTNYSEKSVKSKGIEERLP